MVSVLARKGQAAAMTQAARAGFNLPLEDAPRAIHAGSISALGIGPGRWMFIGAPIESMAALKAVASLSEQGDGYSLFEIGGGDAERTLAKGVPLDLEAFAAGADSVTSIAHIGAIIWKNAAGNFCVAVFRSYTGSFWHWLSASAAEFGLKLEQET
jgi:sarcosine oxidase subunit gamma